jgi:hypothetical protein
MLCVCVCACMCAHVCVKSTTLKCSRCCINGSFGAPLRMAFVVSFCIALMTFTTPYECYMIGFRFLGLPPTSYDTSFFPQHMECDHCPHTHMLEMCSLSQVIAQNHVNTCNHYNTYLLCTVDTINTPKGVHLCKPLHTSATIQGTSELPIICVRTHVCVCKSRLNIHPISYKTYFCTNYTR